jgi:hypothetical protein
LEAIEQPIEFGWTCVYYLHTLIMPCSPLIWVASNLSKQLS